MAYERTCVLHMIDSGIIRFLPCHMMFAYDEKKKQKMRALDAVASNVHTSQHRTHNIVPTQSNTLHRTKVSKSNGKKITCHHWILPFYSIVAVPSELSFSLEWIFDFSHSSLRFDSILNIFLTLIVTSDFTKRPFIETLNLRILYLFAETSSVSHRPAFPLSFLFINLTLNCHIFLEIFQSRRHISYLLLLLVKQMQQKPKYTNTYTRPD